MQFTTINSTPDVTVNPIGRELTPLMLAPTVETRSFICNDAYETAAILIAGLLGLSSIVLVMMNYHWTGMGVLTASCSGTLLIADCRRLSQKMSDIYQQKVQYLTAQGAWDAEKIENELRSVKVLVFYPKRVQNYLYPKLVQRYFRNDQIGNV